MLLLLLLLLLCVLIALGGAQSPRPRFWHLAIADCDKEDDLRVRLHVYMHFRQDSGTWNEEFSFEERGLLSMYIVFSVIWSLITIPVFFSGYVLWRRDQYFFVCDALVALLHCCCALVHQRPVLMRVVRIEGDSIGSSFDWILCRVVVWIFGALLGVCCQWCWCSRTACLW
jgi:hypothetical protein